LTSPPFDNGDVEKVSSAHPAVNQMEYQAVVPVMAAQSGHSVMRTILFSSGVEIPIG